MPTFQPSFFFVFLFRGLLADQGLLVHLAELLKVVQLPSTKANIAAALSLLTRSETQTWSLLASGALETLVGMLRVAQTKSTLAKPTGTPWVTPQPPSGKLAGLGGTGDPGNSAPPSTTPCPTLLKWTRV